MALGVFPMFKLTGLALMQLSRPVGNFIRRYAENHPLFRRHFILTPAQFYNRLEVRLKMWTMGLNQPKNVPELKEAAAIELATHILEEIIVFILAAGVVVYEIKRSNKKSTKKTKSLQTNTKSVLAQMASVQQMLDEQDALIMQLDRIIRKMENNARMKKTKFFDLIEAEKQNKELMELENEDAVKKVITETEIQKNLNCQDKKFGVVENLNEVIAEENVHFETENVTKNKQEINVESVEPNANMEQPIEENIIKLTKAAEVDATCETVEQIPVAQNLLKSDVLNDSTKFVATDDMQNVVEMVNKVQKDVHETVNNEERTELIVADNKEETKEIKEVMNLNTAKDSSEAENFNESMNVFEVKDLNVVNATKDISETKTTNEATNVGDVKEFNEAKIFGEANDFNESTNILEVKDFNEAKTVGEANDFNESTNIIEVKDLNESKDLNEATNIVMVEDLNEVNAPEVFRQAEHFNEATNVLELKDLNESHNVPDTKNLNVAQNNEEKCVNETNEADEKK